MTRTRRPGLRALGLGALAFGASGLPGAAQADSVTLPALMALLAQRQHGEADFEQVQYLAALRQPARSSGIMIYDAPAHLEERILQPHPSSMVLDHEQLTIRNGSRQRELRLEDYPQLAPLIDSIRATLAGDQAALEQRFELALSGDLDHWELQLHPRLPESARVVQAIRIAGERDAILQVEVRQGDGDHSLMTIRPRS